MASLSAEMQPTLTVHHLSDSRSQRILWLLEELEVPYTIKKYNRDPETRLAPKEMRETHPLGKAPIITDGDVTLGESGAIVEYLISKYGKGHFQPPESGKIDNLYFSHYCEGSLMPILVNHLIFTVVPAKSPWFIRPFMNFIFGRLINMLVIPPVKRNVEFLEGHLSKSESGWFAGGGEPTTADFMMSFALEAICAEVPHYSGPRLREYVEKVQTRPAYQKALKRGGEYKFAQK